MLMILRTLCGLFASSLLLPLCFAQNLLRPPTTGTGAAGEYFGQLLLRDGNDLLVSSPLDNVISPLDGFGIEAGSLSVFDGSLLLKQKIAAPEFARRFASALDVSAQWLVVGAPEYADESSATNAGAVYLYERTPAGFILRHTQLSPEITQSGEFGAAVVLSGNQLWVGMPGAEVGRLLRYQIAGDGSLTQLGTVTTPASVASRFARRLYLLGSELWVAAGGGQVLLYDINNLQTPVQTLSGPESLGESLIALPNQRLLVGAPNADNRGVVRRYQRSGAEYQLLDEVSAGDGQAADRFGQALVSDGVRVWIAAPGRDGPGGFDVGALYASSLTTFQFSTALLANNPSDNALHGQSMVISAADQLLVSAPLAVVDGVRVGVVRRYASLAQAPLGPELPRLDPGVGAQQHLFGWEIAIAGDVLSSGALLADSNRGNDAGLVHVYRRNAGQWQFAQTLAPAEAASDQRFGSAVALTGNQLLAGAVWDSTQGLAEAGAVTVFSDQGGSFVSTQRLFAGTPQLRANFGSLLVAEGDTAAIAAPLADGNSNDEGAVYLFERAAGVWSERQRLSAPVLRTNVRFGSALALSGDLLLVGAPQTAVNTVASAGAAYLFRREQGAWVLSHSIFAPETAPAQFGASVALGAGELLIAAPLLRRPNEAPFGRVYRYRCAASCTLVGTLEAPGAPAGAQFGGTLNVFGTRALIAAPFAIQGNQPGAGEVYRYEYVDRRWQLLETISSSDVQSNAAFGFALAQDAQSIASSSLLYARDNPAEGAVEVQVQRASLRLFADGFE
jgi:hypothetical protein